MTLHVFVANYAKECVTFNKGQYIGHIEPSTDHIPQTSINSLTIQKTIDEHSQPDTFTPPLHTLPGRVRKSLNQLLETFKPEAFPIPNKKADKFVHVYIRIYMPIHMCPHFILPDNGTEFKNQLMDNLHQLSIDHIFSAPYQPQINGKLEVFHKYLKPTLTKLCEKDPDNWHKYINQVLASYCVTPHLATAETPFFLVYGRDPNFPSTSC